MFGTAFIAPVAAASGRPRGDAAPPAPRPPPAPRSFPRRALLAAGVVTTASALLALVSRAPVSADTLAAASPIDPRAVSDDAWAAKLSPQAYRVLRQSGTERPFSSALNREHRAGRYVCGACASVGVATELFASGTKFESGTGWPSFSGASDAVELVESTMDKLMMQRECRCGACGSHLGHVFKDGPRPTGLRHCINGVALEFRPESSKVVKSYPTSRTA